MENTRRKLLENKIELVDEIIEEIIELPAESEGMNELPSYTEKNYRELSAVEKEDLINSLMKDDYLKYKNCYISRSKLLYDSSETLIKEISALSQLNELGYEIYLLPYSYARDSMNFYKKSADSITYGDFLELKSTISTNERAGQNCYEAGRKQADNIYISFVNDISEEKALKSIYGSIGNIKKGNRKHNIEDNFKGLLFLNFEKKGEIHLYDISKEGYVTKIENPSFENLKKILEDNKISQVIVNPSNERRSPRDLNLHQDIESVKMNEVKVNELNLNKKSSKPDMQIDKTSISSESPSFPVEPQLSLGSRANHILLENDTERQEVIKKLNKIKTEKIEPREFLLKIKEAFNFADKKTSDYVSNRIKNSRFTLRLSDHSVNADYVSDKYIETSIVIRLSYNEFKKSQDKYVIEFEYKPEMLTPEKKQQIIDNLKTWTLTGQYPETDIEPKYSPSEVEWKKANAKMLNYVNTHSSKIQKYAETIDNSQTENPEESVEKSSKDIKPEISVVCGEIKSILGNKFTGGNIKLSQDFQHELIEKGLVNPEEEFVLINDAEAVAQGCKIKSDQPFVFLNIPVENNGKTDFVQTKYYHVSALEESQKIEKNIIYGETKVPEFAIITQHGLKTYSNLIIESYDPTSHSYLLQSEDGSQRLNITEETYNELMSNTFQEKAQSFTNDEPAYNKLLETQYNDYFKQRDNTAYNFKHNLSVYCRKEANSPCNALEIAKGIISRMSVEEKNKTKSLLKKIANGKTLNEVIVDIYHEAIKEVPLNEEYIKIKVPEKVIARPFYDTISTNGDLVSKEHNLKIGDTLKNVNIKSDKLFGKGSENITFDELKIISSSKEGNCITLMDSNKSFVEVPLDTVLSSYEKYKSNTQKIEKRNTVSMDISY